MAEYRIGPRTAFLLAACFLWSCESNVAAPAGRTCAEGCDDQNACTIDACVEGLCVNTYDEASCCTSDQCDIGGLCYDNGERNPDSPCQVCRVLQTAQGWSTEVGACDDGDPCTVGDSCQAGVCQPGGAVDCDDGNACTDDVCTAAAAASTRTTRPRATTVTRARSAIPARRACASRAARSTATTPTPVPPIPARAPRGA